MADQQTVDQKDVVFTPPLQMFASRPYNDIFTEFREEKLVSNPVNPLSDVYTFTRPANNVGLLKTSDARISARLSVKAIADGAQSAAGSGYSILPAIMRTMWRSKEVKINDVLVSSESDHAYLTSYLKLFTREVNSQRDDDKRISLSYFDTASAAADMDTITGYTDGTGVVNLGARRRIQMTRNVTTSFIDMIDTVLFNEDSEEIYLPTAFKIELRLTRETHARVFQGANLGGGLAIAAVGIHLDDLEITIPVYKPKQQLGDAINHMLVNKNAECKYYTSTFRTIAIPMAANRRSHQAIDIFNGLVPTRCYMMYQGQDNYNGSYATNVFKFQFTGGWPTKIEFTVNNVTYKTIKSSQDAYVEYRKVLNRKQSEMPINYTQYVNGYGIVAVDLTSNQDSHLSVLPLRPSGVVSCNVDFSDNTAAGFLLFVGEFRNEIKIGLKTPPRSLHDF